MIKTGFALALMIAASPAAAKIHVVSPSSNDHETLQTALIEAAPGDTIMLQAGKYTLGDGLSLDVDNVTVRGAGSDKTILSFKGQTGAGEGLLVTSDRVLLTEFAVEDTKGDGIKAKGVNRITFDKLRVEWTNGPDAKNGAYGIYPVESSNVLVQNSVVIACADAGVYVGQSDNIVVRGNRVEYNVAGIEIENSTHADVYDNIARHNTGGILIFDLPNLPRMGGHSTRIYNNVVENNDTPNFAAPGNIVASVPQGLGIMVMANENVEVFSNTITGNRSAGVMVVAYQAKYEDPKYNPLARKVSVFANAFGENGFDPKFPGGAELASAVGGRLPPLLWDGVTTYAGAPAGAAPSTAPVSDVPGISLGLGTAGTPTTAAKPVPLAPSAIKTGTLKPIVLPADQPLP